LALVTMGAIAGNFGRDVDRGVAKVVGIIDSAAREGVQLLVFPDACLGGYIGDLLAPDPHDPPPALDPDGPEIAAVITAAGPMTVCVGYAEAVGVGRYNAAICVSGDGVLGTHRKVHQPAGEGLAYLAGDSFAAFDTPVGRLGMLIDYDKTFPESARALALDGAQVIAALSAWPASVTDRASRLPADRQSRLFDLYDCARAAENQVVLVSSNQTGVMGSLRFLGQAKVVGPGGDVLVSTGSKGGLAKVTIDAEAELARARKVLNHLAERRVDAYDTRVPVAPHVREKRN
jgi:predicted amidohydrolase